MSKPILRKGDRGEEVFELQSLLNRVGAMLKADKDFGGATERGVRYTQGLADQPPTGVADALLWDWLALRPEPFPLLDANGVAFIAREETGGLAYYDSVTQWPHFPGESSGVTIGVGYDLQYNTESGFRATWDNHLSSEVLTELAKDIGRKGSKERVAELRQRGVFVPFKYAWAVFIEHTLPRFYRSTEGIYPSLGRLPRLCRAVLVSIVYNRGDDLTGDRRKEMKAIQTILAGASQAMLGQDEVRARLAEIEGQIVAMKRLWSEDSGLPKRRQAEADLWRAGLAEL